MSIFDFISSIFKPAADLIDNISTTDEERLELQNKFAEIQKEMNTKLIELEQQKIDALQKVQVAEANSSHWLTANWRPLCSVAIVGLIIAGSFGVVSLTKDIYDLAQIFLGTYAGSRGLEKIATTIIKR